MKTKHLLFATALVASLAACTNDDFVVDGQQPVANDGRPTVSNVKLNFTGDTDTRLVFNGEYAWEATDTIGALLMDNVETLDADKTWLQKYDLVKYIHTSYPFTYNSADKSWGCNTKMLEGNYFFAFPWESYDGNRQVKHSIIGQQQTGVGSNVVRENYAKNQFFIGYSQIKAGTEAKEALDDVEMTSILGAIQLRIVNTGTQTYHINKIVLKGSKLSSALTFDPTNAEYTDFNLSDESGKTFNYANYTGNKTDLYEEDGDYVYNADKNPGYERMAALRAVVKKVGAEKSAQLIINGTKAQRALVSTKTDESAVAYALVMANAHKIESNDNLSLSIYTDEGMVSDIDLTEINTELNKTNGSSTAITSSKVEEIAPNVSNTIRVQIDDNSFNTPEDMEIYNNDDLLQFIKWNGLATGARAVTATLEENVELTKEMFDLLKAHTNVTLTIKSNESEVLTLAEDVPADALDYAKLTVTSPVKVTGTLTLTKNTANVASIEVAEGATLNINAVDANVPVEITNEGTLNIGALAKVATDKNGNKVTITNKGSMIVAKGGDVKAETVNGVGATLTDNGYVKGVENKGEITMGKGAILIGSTNAKDAVITTAEDAQVTLTGNNGEVKYVAGALVEADGIISAEVLGTVTENTFDKDEIGCEITKLILKPGVTTIADDLSFANVVVSDGAELSVKAGKTLSVTNELTVEGDGTLKGAVEAENLVVEKGAALTIAKDAEVTATNIDNEGIVYNNGAVYTNDATVGAWKYNEPDKIETPDTSKQDAMDAAVKTWAGYWKTYVSDEKYKEYYECNPYSVDGFVAAVKVWVGEKKGVAENLVKVFGITNETGKTYADILGTDEKGNAATEFTTAVDAVLTEKNLEAVKAAVINATTGAFQNVTFTQDATLYKSETAAYNAARTFLANAENVTGIEDYQVAAAAWKLTDAEIAAALGKTTNGEYQYIWKGCPLDEVMKVVRKLTLGQWKEALGVTALGTGSLEDMESVKKLLRASYSSNSTSAAVTDLKNLYNKYSDFEEWGYSSEQVAEAGK